MPITFHDLQEAREYMDRMGKEGYYTTMESLGKGSYSVVLGKKKTSGLGFYIGKGKIVLPPKASTKTKLHELGHKYFGHEPEEMLQSELARREIEAESFAYEKMDKKIDYRVGIPAIVQIVEYGADSKEALRIITEQLNKRGVKVSRQEEDMLLGYAESVA